MADSFQKEIPKARINITLDIETGGARKKKELPLKLLVLGDFSKSQTTKPVALRERINVNKNNFDQVMADLSPTLKFSVPNLVRNDGTELPVQLQFNQFKDFHPDHLIQQIPALNKLLAMRNLLKDLKANLLDNNAFRRALEKLASDQTQLLQLRKELQGKTPFMEEEN